MVRKSQERKVLDDSIVNLENMFLKKEFRDLRPHFWASLADLRLIAVSLDGTDEEVIMSFSQARRHLGAPGDFGYGTPCGDALKAFYNHYSDFINSINRRMPTTQEE